MKKSKVFKSFIILGTSITILGLGIRVNTLSNELKQTKMELERTEADFKRYVEGTIEELEETTEGVITSYTELQEGFAKYIGKHISELEKYLNKNNWKLIDKERQGEEIIHTYSMRDITIYVTSFEDNGLISRIYIR